MSPRIGDYAYLGVNGENPVTVIAVIGEKVFYTWGHVNLLSTHQGNLYSLDNDRPWLV